MLAARATGDTSEGPCGAALTPWASASAKIFREWLMPPAWTTAVRM